MTERYIWSHWWLNHIQLSKTIVNIYRIFFFAGLIKRPTNKIWHGEHYYHLAQNLEFDSCVLLVSVLKKCLRKVTKDADEGTHQDKDAARQPGENNLTRLVTPPELSFPRARVGVHLGHGYLLAHNDIHNYLVNENDLLCAKYILLWNITTLSPCIFGSSNLRTLELGNCWGWSMNS